MSGNQNEQAWYIISAINMEEVKILLDNMGVEYYIPFTLRPQARHQKLQIAENQLLGNYIFVKLDVVNQYYFLKHNKMFEHNIIDVLRVGNEFVKTDGHEVETWRYLCSMFQIPVKFHKVNERYFPADPELATSNVLYFSRKRLKAVIEINISGEPRVFHVAAFNDDNIKPIGLEMKALHDELSKNKAMLFEPDIKIRLAWMRNMAQRIHEKISESVAMDVVAVTMENIPVSNTA